MISKMNCDNTISGDRYDVQIDRLNHLIYAQEMIVHLRQDHLISEPSFLERWIYYEYMIRSIFDFLRNEGFIVRFDSEKHRPLLMKPKKGTNLHMRNR